MVGTIALNRPIGTVDKEMLPELMRYCAFMGLHPITYFVLQNVMRPVYTAIRLHLMILLNYPVVQTFLLVRRIH
jgi:hypothetical protein